MIPVVSAGSNQLGASETCTAHVSSPSGAAVTTAGASRARSTARARAIIEGPVEGKGACRAMWILLRVASARATK